MGLSTLNGVNHSEGWYVIISFFLMVQNLALRLRKTLRMKTLIIYHRPVLKFCVDSYVLETF